MIKLNKKDGAVMAKLEINRISKIEKNSHLHDSSECTYNVFQDGTEKYIQFDTYGSDKRKFRNKVSQSIQFDKETAALKINILKKEFNL